MKNLVVIVGVVVFVCLVWVIKPRYGSVAPPSPIIVAMTQVATLSKQLGAFRDDTGSYPTGTNALQGLLQQPSGVTNWHGPYTQETLKDPWGQNYVYEYPGKHTASGYPYDLLSLGPPGPSKPIANWANPHLKP